MFKEYLCKRLSVVGWGWEILYTRVNETMKEDKTINKNWKNSEYEKLTRIKLPDLDWLKENKGELSIAGYLHYIIQCHKAKK